MVATLREPALLAGRLESPCPPQEERPAPRRSHAGRSLATRPQREPGRRNLSTCLINGGAETAAQTGPRQPHKEEAPWPLPPCIDPSPLWLGQRERRRAGTRPILIRGEGPGGPLAPSPQQHPFYRLQAADRGGGESQVCLGTGWGRNVSIVQPPRLHLLRTPPQPALAGLFSPPGYW